MNQPLRIGKFVPGQRKPMMAMIEITDRCNLSCPVCFARSTSCGTDISVDQARTYLKQLLEITETPIPIQISGGEPTLHPELAAIITAARPVPLRLSRQRFASPAAISVSFVPGDANNRLIGLV